MFMLASFTTMPALNKMNRTGCEYCINAPSLLRYTDSRGRVPGAQRDALCHSRAALQDLRKRARLQAFIFGPLHCNCDWSLSRLCFGLSLGSSWPDLSLDEYLHFNLQCKAIGFKERQATGIRSVFL